MALTKITSHVMGSGAVTAASLSGITTDNVSEGSSNTYFTNARARGAVSVTGGNLSYDSSSGVIQLTTDTIRSRFSAGTGISISSGSISTSQDISTSGTPTFGNTTLTGYLRGPSTFTIDPSTHGDNTGTVVIAGNLQVDGTTTTINSTTLTVDDKLVTLASGSANAGAANGAGIEVDISGATNPSLLYDGTNNEWDFNKNVRAESFSVGAGPTSELLFLSGAGHNGHGTTNTRSVASFNQTGQNAGLWFGARNNDNTAVIGTRTASGNLAFETYNSGWGERMRLTNDGKLGIGTDSPSNKLDIKGTVGFEATNSTNRWLAYTYTDNTFRLNYNGAGADEVLINSSGNVGIGETSPDTTLHVKSANDTVAIVESSDATAKILIKDSDSTHGTSLCVTNEDFFMQVNGGEKLRVASDGKVGIGTNSPDTPLHVLKSDNDVTLLKLHHSSANSGTADYAHYGEILIQGGTHPKSGIRAYSNGYQTANSALAFWTNQHGGSYAERMRIKGDGKVGIGTNDPDSFLEIFNNSVSGNTQLHIHNDKSGDAAVLRLEAKRSSLNDTGQIIFANDGSICSNIRNYSAGDSGELRFYTSTSGTGNSISEAIRLTNNGNLQFINTTTNIIDKGFSLHTNGYLYLRGGSSGLILADDANHNTIQIIDGSNGYINFETSNGTSRMKLDANGNLFVGTNGTAASHYGFGRTLEVQGGANAEVNISQTDHGKNWSLGIVNGTNYQQTDNSKYMWEIDGTSYFSLDTTGIHFEKADGQLISAKESIAIKIDEDNNTASRVFQVIHGNGKTLLNLHDDYRGEYGTIHHAGTRTAGYGQSNGLGASAGDWVDIASVPYGRNIATIKIFWDGIFAPNSSHHGNMEFDIGSHYGTSYVYGWDSYINLKASSAHNSFHITEARIITPGGSGATGYFQVKFGVATGTQGTIRSYVTHRDEQCSISPMTPAVNNSRSGTTIADVNLETRPSMAASRDFTSKGMVRAEGQPGFLARGNTSQWMQAQAAGWCKIVSGISNGSGGTIGVNLTEGSTGHWNGYDTGSDFNTSNGRFTAPVAGKYLVHGSLYCAKFNLTLSDYMHFNIYVNGQNINQTYSMGGHRKSYNHDFDLKQSTVLYLEEGDYVEYQIYATSTNMRVYGDHLSIGAHLIS